MAALEKNSERIPTAHSQARAQRRATPRCARRRGLAFVYTALGLTVVIMLLAVVVDIGLLYQRKAKMQRAADSAALAGAHKLANFGTSREAYIAAGDMAARPENGSYTKRGAEDIVINGVLGPYIANVGDSKFDIQYPAKDENGVQHNNWFRVVISRPQSALFGGMWPLNKQSYGVVASATALYETLAELDIKGTGTYGVAPGPVNLSLFGPDGRYSYGDPYSTKRLNNGSANPKYNVNGYDFAVKVPANQRNTTVEIFDPDCYNSNGSANASANAIDELRTSTGNGGPSNATRTEYTLYWDRGTIDTNDDVRIGNPRSWAGNSPATDMKWIEAFEFDRANYVGGNFRLNVRSTAGSSENGFDLRAGPKRTPSAPNWNPENGSTIQAQGHLPINFNISGTTKMTLGRVPAVAGGGELVITKFDTDINSKSIKYTCDKIVGPQDGGWYGTLSTDGTFATDTIRIPDAYKNINSPGTWYAEYVAGDQDTSVWDMSYTNAGPGAPGRIKLVR